VLTLIRSLNSSLSLLTPINCDLDPILTPLFKQFSHNLLPPITNIINISLSTGIFPDQFKSCSVNTHLKTTSSLDKDVLSNHRPISHLLFLSKLTEIVIKLRLVDYLCTNSLGLLNSFQSAYMNCELHDIMCFICMS